MYGETLSRRHKRQKPPKCRHSPLRTPNHLRKNNRSPTHYSLIPDPPAPLPVTVPSSPKTPVLWVSSHHSHPAAATARFCPSIWPSTFLASIYNGSVNHYLQDPLVCRVWAQPKENPSTVFRCFDRLGGADVVSFLWYETYTKPLAVSWATSLSQAPA